MNKSECGFSSSFAPSSKALSTIENGLTKCSALLCDGQAGSTSEESLEVELDPQEKDPGNAVIFPHLGGRVSQWAGSSRPPS
jgi:hypothetical protein